MVQICRPAHLKGVAVSARGQACLATLTAPLDTLAH